MNQENPVYLKLNYLEVKEGEKEILASQIHLLELKKSLSQYKKLRLEELKKREKWAQKVKNIKTNITKLGKTLPTIKRPKSLRKEKKEIKLTKRITSSSLEQELNRIKAKLQKLEE